MDKEIEKIIVKFLTNGANEEDLNKLANWLNVKNNVQFFDQYITTNYALDMNMNEFDSKSVKNALAKKIRQNKNAFYKYRLHKITKYAAAAIIVFSLGYFFRDNIFNQTIEEDVAPTIVDTNIIVPGSDKATLTLEDGSQITLEKGETFQTQNASSNGEEIFYEKGKENITKVVYNYLTIPRGGEYFVKLPDGTQVWLNSESQLKFPVNFIEGETREVELVYGEAYFDVSPSSEHKGTKFKVFNQFQEIEVLGTEFNIKAYKDETNIYTTLVEGKVNVGIENKNQSLIPNQQLNLDTNNNTSIIKTVDVYNEVSWKDGVFSFENKTLEEVIKVLSRWYNIEIVFKNNSIKNEEFIGILRKNKSLKVILESIKNYGIIKNFEIGDKKVVLE